MSKNLIYKVLACLLLVGASVVWLLSQLGIIEGINLSFVIAIVCAGLGVVLILKAFTKKTVGVAKKFYVFVAAGFFIAAVLALVGTFIDKAWVLPIIAVVISVSLLISFLVVGGKKWDSGDNEKVGYKNYYQRKEEERKKSDSNN